jgi:hypothetical protein
MIRTGSGLQKNITYVVSGQWIEGISTTPLTIEAGGYVEILVQAQPALKGTDGQAFSMGNPSTNEFDPNNRFTADVLITGTYTDPAETWNPITLRLVLNVVEISGAGASWILEPPSETRIPTATFLAGQTTPYLLYWEGTASLWPYEPDDYYSPIEHVLGPVAGNIISPDEFLSMSPSPLVVVWSSPPPMILVGTQPTPTGEVEVYLAAFNATSQVTAAWYSGNTNGSREFTLMQTFFNGSINSPGLTGPLYYEIKADIPIVSG